MRTKQINVSIPKDSLPLLAEFDASCKNLGLSRSEVLIELMLGWVDSPKHDLCEHSANEPDLPEWMT